MGAVTQTDTIRQLLTLGEDASNAIEAPERSALDYLGLRLHVDATAASLNAVGIGRNDRVAIVLPNGPEMASAFLAVAVAATTAPLNPGYRRDEFDFYLKDLGAKALVALEGDDNPAVGSARALGIAVLRLRSRGSEAAGSFELIPEGEPNLPAASPGHAEADDIALVLHTSGTTSRPKIVPLTQRNLCASAANISGTLALRALDRCLNVMPLFHIHGLMACVLATLSRGGTVIASPGFNALRFFKWLDEMSPTWYSAVPTMHQAILARAARNAGILEKLDLRLIRSSSASLPPQVMTELERVFGAPVIEAYAMTEAAHQMTSNPLPPKPRKPGSVGMAAGPEVAVMDAEGKLLESGQVGEIVIRGENVTGGYENNPAANSEAFQDGWLRTGDEGVSDESGYFRITGRLKEIINRGGEKISPREVDDVLMDHPAVEQVVTFAVAHPKLGEEVASAVVLREGAEASDTEIRAFASERLAEFKVPRRVVFLDEIPKGPTGKLRRIGLAEQLGLE
jgi:acyl-CoA synthetase (AMP-forming)/AMP-acid ligase II